MTLELAYGLTLHSCKFSKCSVSFEFAGMVSGVFRQILVSTTYSISAGLGDASSVRSVSEVVWPFLEKILQEVNTVDSGATRYALFKFDDGSSFTVWGVEPFVDEVLIVTTPATGEWFTLL